MSNSNGNALFEVTDTAVETVTYTAADVTDSMSGWTVAVEFTAAAPPTTTTTTTSTTVPASAVATTTTTGGSSDTGASPPSDSGSSDTGSAGTGTATGSNLAFTGAPADLPWVIGLGAILLLFGALGRVVLTARKRDQ